MKNIFSIYNKISMILPIIMSLLAINILVYLLKYRLVFKPSRNIPIIEIGIPYEEINICVNDTESINMLHFPRENCEKLFIFSHGTSGNLYHRVKLVENIMNKLETSVILYDYRGYGRSIGSCSEENLYQDIETVYNCAIQKYKPENIILYGSSLGTIPTIHLASTINCKLVILHAPFVSLRQIIPWYLRYFIYFAINDFNMIEKIKSIKSPTLIFHSTDDNVIPYWHSTEIINNLTNEKLLIPLQGKHGKIKVTEILPVIQYFIND